MPRLFTHNVKVDKWNEFQLSGLPGDNAVLDAVQTGPDLQRAFLIKNLLTPATLRLKPVFPEGTRELTRPGGRFANNATVLRWRVAIAAIPASSRVRDSGQPRTVAARKLLRVEAAAGDAPAVGTQQVEERRQHGFGLRQFCGVLGRERPGTHR